MIHLTFRTQALLLTMPLLTLIASHHAHAEIYKWRDNRGVTQYSDRPPVSTFSKLTPNELVNSLQTKDLCSAGKKSVSPNVAATRDYNGFYNIFAKSRGIAASIKNTAIGGSKLIGGNALTGGNNITTRNTAGVTKNSAPVKNTVASNINTQNVSMLSFAKQTIKTGTNSLAGLSKPLVTAPSIALPPIVAAPPVIKSTAPTATAPPATMPPTQVVTAPPGTTIPVNLPNIVQTALMPAVNISKNIVAAVGFSNLRIEPTSEQPGGGDGAFRMNCEVSHMSNDDPIVYPRQQGAAHHHTFFGNTSINYNSDMNNVASVGNSTCMGGIMNRSGYWVPSMINTETSMPIIPDSILVYYKPGEFDGTKINPPPKGLRMIAGDAKSTLPADWRVAKGIFICYPGPNSTRKTWANLSYIPSGKDCESGDELVMGIDFPQCWDGKNLDSLNHKDHMSYTVNSVCPSTHPVIIPRIGFNIHFKIPAGAKLDKWRLASDNYSNNLPGGYSVHGDWVNGWDENLLAGIVKNCLNAKKDGHAHLLCDGRKIF